MTEGIGMDNKDTKKIKGVRIRTINYSMILMASALYVLIIYTTVHLSLQYKKLSEATDTYIESVRQANLVTSASDYLTMKARLYAVNKDPSQVESYFTEVHVTKRREHALSQLEKENASPEAYGYLKDALEKSGELMRVEIYSMKLVAVATGQDLESFPQEVRDMRLTEEDRALSNGAMLEKAVKIVFDVPYEDAKESISYNISRFIDTVLESTQMRQIDSSLTLKRAMERQRLYISLLFVLNILNFVLVIALIVKPLQVYIRCIKEDRMLEISGAYEFKYLALTYNDIYEVNAANESMLRHKAEHDALTGLINRGGFDQLRQLLKAQKKPIAFLLIDVDKFKEVNDEHGHEAGDKVLKKVASLLRVSFRSKDYVARIGGDEFSVIMMDTTPQMTELIREKINNLNWRLKNPNDGLPQVSLSVGVAFSDTGFTDNLYPDADSALYQVKENGRCGCDFYEDYEEE